VGLQPPISCGGRRVGGGVLYSGRFSERVTSSPDFKREKHLTSARRHQGEEKKKGERKQSHRVHG